jgi:hypothetical protein
LLELVVMTLFWWHPVLWWARHHIEVAEEECADAWAVEQSGGSPRTYAEALLAVVDFVSVGNTRLPPAASAVGSHLLRRRLTAIMAPRTKELSLAPDGYAAIMLVACIVLPPCPALWNLAMGRAPGTMSGGGSQPSAVRAVLPEQKDQRHATSMESRSPLTARRPLAVTSTNGIALTMDAHRRVRLGHSGRQFNLGVGRVAAADFLPDSKHVVLGGFDGALEVVDCQTGQVQQRVRLGVSAITSVACAPDRVRVIAAGSRDGMCRLVDLESGRSDPIRTWIPRPVCAFFGHGKALGNHL